VAEDASGAVGKRSPNLEQAGLIIWSRGQCDNELKNPTNEARIDGTFKTELSGIIESVANGPTRASLERGERGLKLLGRNRVERSSNCRRPIDTPRRRNRR
jgi:hypothetical protein